MGMEKKNYNSNHPLHGLENGEEAVIYVLHSEYATAADKEKYKNVAEGIYYAICIRPYFLQCNQQTLLSGQYNYWHGEKRACSEYIRATKKKE